MSALSDAGIVVWASNALLLGCALRPLAPNNPNGGDKNRQHAESAVKEQVRPEIATRDYVVAKGKSAALHEQHDCECKQVCD
jgi:hypothetical protein